MVHHRFSRWRRDRRANVAILTALVMIPLVGLCGLAVDFGSAVAARASLDAAADSAALLATTVASNQYLAGVANPTAAAKTAAAARFNAQAGAIASVTLGTVSVGVTQSGPQFASTVTYAASYQTALGPVVGVNSIALNGVSASSLSVKPYVDIQVMMDVSASMLIAATTADIASMQALTSTYVKKPGDPDNASQSCAFACHWNTTGTDYLAMARTAGITLRLDVLRSAVGNLITNVAALNKQSAFRFGMSTFARAFTSIYAMSSNIAGATPTLAQISPDVNLCGSDCAETNFTAAITGLAGITGTSGDGSTQDKSQKFLFIVTDGLVDQGVDPNRTISPISPSDCQTMKNKGVTILTLYTPYVPLKGPPDGTTVPANDYYMQHVWQYQSMGSPDAIQQAMSACATKPAFAYVATDAAQIDAQLTTMLATVLQTSGHFTQ